MGADALDASPGGSERDAMKRDKKKHLTHAKCVATVKAMRRLVEFNLTTVDMLRKAGGEGHGMASELETDTRLLVELADYIEGIK